MAKGNAVWGIDIGQCALKALRCRPHEKEPRRLVIEAFDYIEYPKILTQPEAEPVELVREALETFKSRNDLTGDTVAISVSGQSGLARFIKLPPVESKKIPDIVKYEARQQIPFSLDDVVWDYQQLTGGSEEDGFALEPEVGLFAMKRDQVAKALAPLEQAGVEVDLIQLTPLAVYNYVVFDRLPELRSQPYDPAKPPASTVVISVGTDTTDLVVTNGYRVWQRNIPIGGNHFTRALSKELKLTFVKAEHLKRHAMQADDPKAVFQAMRPVFSDLLAEIQRSLGYFMSLDKAARVGEVIALGNAMKLPGLQRYLAQNLEQEVKPIEEFDHLTAGSAAGSAQYKDNVLSFAPAYGLCIQALGKSELKTNLLPEEIVKRRMVRAKKPWAVAGVAAVLAGLTFNYFSHVSAWSEANVKDQGWAGAISKASSTSSMANSLESARKEIHTAVETIEGVQTKLISNVEGRVRWLELMRAIDEALPHDNSPREDTAAHVMARNELHITSIDNQFFTDLGTEYWANVEELYLERTGGQPGADATAGDDTEAAAPAAEPPSGEGWLIQLTGHHYHNADKTNDTQRYVYTTLIKGLEEKSIKLPDGPNGELVDVPIKDLVISHPFIVADTQRQKEIIDPDAVLYGEGGGRPLSLADSMGLNFNNPAADDEDEDAEGGQSNAAAPGTIDPATGMPVSRAFTVDRYNFVVQFCWSPKTREERREAAQALAEAAAAAVGEESLEGEAPLEEPPLDEAPADELEPPADELPDEPPLDDLAEEETGAPASDESTAGTDAAAGGLTSAP